MSGSFCSVAKLKNQRESCASMPNVNCTHHLDSFAQSWSYMPALHNTSDSFLPPQLAFHDSWDSLLPAGCGVMVALLYCPSFSPLQSFRVPGQILFSVSMIVLWSFVWSMCLPIATSAVCCHRLFYDPFRSWMFCTSRCWARYFHLETRLPNDGDKWRASKEE